MTEAERRKMMEQRQERKAQQKQPKPQHSPQPLALPSTSGVVAKKDPPFAGLLDDFALSPEMAQEIKEIEQNYKESNQKNPYFSRPTSVKSSQKTFDTWMQFCEKIASFFTMFKDFVSLGDKDRTILLRTAMTSAGIIMGAVTVDSWMGKKKPSTGTPVPKVSTEGIKELVPNDLLFRVHQFFKKFRLVCPDETMAKVLMLVTLYSPELSGLEDTTTIQRLQDHYIHLLDCFIKHRFRENAGHMFAKALVSLADVRELAEQSFEMKFNPPNKDGNETVNSDPNSGGHDSNNDRKRDGGFGSSGGPSSSSSQSTGFGGGGSGGINFGSTSGGSTSAGGTSDFIDGASGTSTIDETQIGGSYMNAGDQKGCQDSNGLYNFNSITSNGNYDDPGGYYSHSTTEPSTVNQNSLNLSSRFSGMETRNSKGENMASTREKTQKLIQDIMKSLPTPAVMKIICQLDNSLNIETEKTPEGLKFSTKHDSSPSQLKLQKRRSSGSKRKVLRSTTIASGCSSLNIDDILIKEEAMEIDQNFDALNMIMTDIDGPVLCETTYSLPSNASMVDPVVVKQSNKIHNTSQHFTHPSTIDQYHCNTQDLPPQVNYVRNQSYHKVNHHYKQQQQHNNTTHYSKKQRKHSLQQSLSLQQSTVSSSSNGSYEHLTPVPASTNEQQSPMLSNGTHLNSSEFSYMHVEAASPLSSSSQSSQVHSSTSPRCSPNTPSYHQPYHSYHSNGGTVVQSPVVSPISPSIQMMPGESISTLPSSSTQPSPPPVLPNQSSSYQPPNGSVHHQIMAMSLHSPESPNSSSNLNGPISSTCVELCHPSLHQSQHQYNNFQYMSYGPAGASVRHNHQTVTNYSLENDSAVYSQYDSSKSSSPTVCTTSLSSDTPSPPPFTTSLPSNSSPDNSIDCMDMNLASCSINVSGLTDAEMNAVTTLMRHVHDNMAKYRQEGVPIDTDNLLSSELLASLQKDLASE